MAVYGSTIFIGTNAGLVEIDKKNWHQKYFTPLNSGLKSYFINGLNFKNGILSIVSECKDLVTYDGRNWQTFTYNDSTLENSDEIDKIVVTDDGTVWMIYDDNIVCKISRTDTVFIDYEKQPFSKKAPSRLLADKKGNVWFVAENSILRNNEKKWVIFDSSNTILPGSDLLCLCRDSSGGIWTSSNDVLYQFDGSQWKSFPVPVHPLTRSGIYQCAFDRNGTLWVAFHNGLASYDFKNWKLYSSLQIGYIQEIAVDNDCAVWLGTSGGLYLLNSDTCRQVKVGNADLPSTITCGLIKDTKGALMVGGSDGLSMCSNGVWKKITTQHSIDHLLSDNTGRVIGGSRDGYIFEITDTTISTLYSCEPYCYEHLNQIALDSNGGIWAAFQYHMVHFKDSTSIDTVNIKKSSDCDINAIMVSKTGDVWVTASSSSDKGSAYLFRNGTWNTFDENNSKIKGYGIKALYEDSKGAVWFKDGDSGPHADLLRFGGKRWKRYELWYLLGLHNRYLNAVCEDREGNIWVGTEKGLASWNGKRWWIYPVKDGLWSKGIKSVAIEGNDTMWIASDKTILAIARKDLSQYRKIPARLKKRQIDPDSWYFHALFTSNSDSGMYYINKAIKLNNKEPSYYVRRAETFHFLKKYTDALKDMERAIALGDTSFHGKVILGKIWLALGDMEKAMEYSSAAITTDSSSISPYVVRSLVYYNSGQADSALKYFNRILEKEPKEYPQIYAYKAKIYNDRFQFDSAEMCINKSLALNTSYAGVYFIRAMIHLNQKKYTDAIKAFNASLKLSPGEIGSLQNRGYCFLMMGKSDSALMDFDEVIRLGYRSSDAFSNRGAVLFKLGKYKDAEKDFKHALQLSSDNTTVYANYISMLCLQERYIEAVHFFSRIPAHIQQNHTINAAIGLTYIHLKDYNNALTYLNKAIETDSTDWDPYYNVACVYARQGNAALAVEWLERSFDRGFCKFDHLDRDTDFDSLRNTKAFMELIKRYMK
jgi:tetratricopeptide (TPR) repeat protein/ligand-binding sensor domain-containing protein